MTAHHAIPRRMITGRALGSLATATLAGCVMPPPAGPTATVTVDGRPAYLQQGNLPVWVLATDPGSGGFIPVQSERVAPTVIVEGARDEAAAVRATAAFCGVGPDLGPWASDFHYRDPATGAWWIADMCR